MTKIIHKEYYVDQEDCDLPMNAKILHSSGQWMATRFLINVWYILPEETE